MRIRPLSPSRKLTRELTEQLAAQIKHGRLAPGARLPTEQELTRAARVSRTVVREAVAALRAEGLVVTRQGVGAFVSEDVRRAPFRIDPDGLRSLDDILGIMELRLGVEVESAGLAAERASRTQVRGVGAALDAIRDATQAGLSAVEEDIAFHLAIAEATGNAQFVRFLQFVGGYLIPRHTVSGLPERMGGRKKYFAMLQEEHRKIFEAIRDREPDAARGAMRAHLTGSLERYQGLAAEQRKAGVKILLTHSPEALANYYGERALSALRSAGDVILNRKDPSLEGEELIAAARDCDLIVSYRQSPGPAAVFERLPKLRAFLRCAIDIRNIDVPAASKAGVLVTQASAGFITSVTELVLGFLVDLSRGVTRHATSYHQGKVPTAYMGKELKGATLGVIGYGAIGREVVRVGKALGMSVLVNDPYQKGIEQVSMDELLSRSDYVVPLAVATEETENLINQNSISKMKRGACLINVSRGNLVDEAAVEAALDSGHLAGFAMDVGRAPDQMPTPRLAAREDVIATPHTAGLTPQAIEHQSMETAAQAAEIAKGRAPQGAVNAQHWTRKP